MSSSKEVSHLSVSDSRLLESPKAALASASRLLIPKKCWTRYASRISILSSRNGVMGMNNSLLSVGHLLFMFYAFGVIRPELVKDVDNRYRLQFSFVVDTGNWGHGWSCWSTTTEIFPLASTSWARNLRWTTFVQTSGRTSRLIDRTTHVRVTAAQCSQRKRIFLFSASVFMSHLP